VARAKKSPAKPESADDTTAKTEDATGALSESVQDAVVLDDSDQVVEADEPARADADLPADPSETDARQVEESKPPEPPVAAPRSGPGFFTLLLGGACAAALGFGVSQYLGNDSWPFTQGPSEVETLTPRIDQQASQIETLAADLAALDGQLAAATTDSGRLEQIEQTVQGLNEAVDTLDQRIADLENRPIPDVGATRDAVAAYQDQLAGMRAMFEEELARIEASQATAIEQEQSAADRAKSTMIRASLAQLQAAIDNGAPYSDEVQALTDAGVEIPPALARNATQGVATVAALQQSFPAAAREALNAAIRAQADSGEVDSFTAFLRTQLGARSLEPKEGSDPDAILSRAEAALRDGNVARTLSELEALPEAGAARMADWMATAKTREEAVAATAALADTLNN